MGNFDVSLNFRKEKITKKAQELYVKRGSKPGHDMDDWLAAEKIVDQEVKAQPQLQEGSRTPSKVKSR